MRFRDILSMGGSVAAKSRRKSYWLRNEDGTVSVMVKMSPLDGSKEKTVGMVAEAKEAVREIGEKATADARKVIFCNSFLGFNKEMELEAVGMVTLESDEAVERNLAGMNLVKIG